MSARGFALIGIVILALAGVAGIDQAGYRRALTECRAEADRQQQEIDTARRAAERDWQERADALAARNRELEDAIAANDRAAAAAGAATCLAGDGVRALDAIR